MVIEWFYRGSKFQAQTRGPQDLLGSSYLDGGSLNYVLFCSVPVYLIRFDSVLCYLMLFYRGLFCSRLLHRILSYYVPFYSILC